MRGEAGGEGERGRESSSEDNMEDSTQLTS